MPLVLSSRCHLVNIWAQREAFIDVSSPQKRPVSLEQAISHVIPETTRSADYV